MKWEKVESDMGYFFRTKVPTGWLVMVVDDVLTAINPDLPLQQGYEWRSSVTFVPDSKHLWSIN